VAGEGGKDFVHWIYWRSVICRCMEAIHIFPSTQLANSLDLSEK
jgi:hypothetical protein